MKFLSFYKSGELRVGIKTAEGVVDLTQEAEIAGITVPATLQGIIQEGSKDVVARLVENAKDRLVEEDLNVAAPVTNTEKIICVGTNYKQHAIESNLPVPELPIYFAKFSNSLIGHKENVQLPANAEQIDYEVELVVVIGKQAHKVNASEALDYVFGYATGNDLSARDLQFRNSQWLYGKAIDGFSPLGPYIVTADELEDPQNLPIKCWINGQLKQNSNTEDMIFSIRDIISDLSQVTTLQPGDLIYTGTPEGVILGTEDKQWLGSGDEVTCEVEGLGKLTNTLV